MPCAKKPLERMNIATQLRSPLLVMTALLLLIPVSARTQTVKDEAARLMKEVPIKESYREAGAVTLLKEVRVKVTKDGLHHLTSHVAVKLLDDRAVADYGEIRVPFNSFYDDARLVRARTIGEDGTERSISGDAVQIKTSSEGKQYHDTRYLTFSLPALARGSVFEYEVAVDRKTPVMEGAYSEDVYFHFYGTCCRVDPVYRSSFVLEVPEGKAIRYRTDNIRIAPAIERHSPTMTYTWAANDLPGQAVEPNMPHIAEIAPHVHVSSIAAWEDVAQWAVGLFLPAVETTPEIEAKARGVTRGAQSDEERIEALFYFMERNIRYVAADLGRGGYRPHQAQEVLKNLYGDCKDQAILFISLLKSIGIEAYPALVNSYNTGETNEAVPSPDFSHMIVYVPRKTGVLWLDTTSVLPATPAFSGRTRTHGPSWSSREKAGS